MPIRELIMHKLFALTEAYARKELGMTYVDDAGGSSTTSRRVKICQSPRPGISDLEWSQRDQEAFSRARFSYPTHPMSVSRLYISTGKPTSRHGGLPLKGRNGSTLSELRAAKARYNSCYRIGSFVRKVELLNTSGASEIVVLCTAPPRLPAPVQRTHRLPWRDPDWQAIKLFPVVEIMRTHNILQM
jgi:hypothetical protein